MNLVFSDDFAASLKKHSSIKEAVRKKVNMICKNPVTLGEPLKGNFRGFTVVPLNAIS